MKRTLSFLLFACIACSSLTFAETLEPAEPTMLNSLVLVDESANAVFNLLERFSGRQVLKRQNLPQVKISFDSRGPISQDDAVIALESLLTLNGISIVEMDDKFLKAVPINNVNEHSPEILKHSSLDLKSSEKVYSRYFTLSFLSVNDALAIIRPLASRAYGRQVPIRSSNSILVTDTLASLQRMETILNNADQPLAAEEQLYFFPIKHVDVNKLKTRLQQMQSRSLKRYLGSSLDFEADETSNKLIVVANPSQIGFVERMIANLDVANDPLTRSEVFSLRHSKAKDLATLINSLVKNTQNALQSSGSSSNVNNASNSRSKDPVQALRNASRNASSKNSTELDEQVARFSKTLTIEPDERTNSIVAFGTPRDIEQIRALIDKLDDVLAQVRIEVIIAQVDLDDESVSGLNAFELDYNRGTNSNLFNNSDSRWKASATVNTGTLITASPMSVTGQLAPLALDHVFRVASQKDSVKILSSPTIVTTHNQEASIIVGQSTPVVTSFIGDGTGNNDNSTTAQRSNVEYKDVAIELSVTPLIGNDGVIEMKIKQKVDNILNSLAVNGVDQPVVGKREASSFVSVRDGGVIVLGGLQSRITRDKKGKIFLFGDLPILGPLFFQPKQLTEEVEEVIIFIRPYIIKDTFDADIQTQMVQKQYALGEKADFYIENSRWPTDEELNPKKDNSRRSRRIRRHN